MTERLSNDEVPTFTTTQSLSPILTEPQFLSQLITLLTSTNTAAHGSVYLTQKPLPPPSPETPSSDSPSQILIRATNGLSKPHRVDKKLNSEKPKIKLSTVVDSTDIEVFYAKYAEVCKKGMEGLRKRDKKKAKAKKKKGKGGEKKVV